MHLGLQETIFILVVALIVVGPRKLPEVGRQLGKFMAEFKRASSEFKSQIETEMLKIELDERAKKQAEGPQVLPPEQPWERMMRPLTDTVSRTTAELSAMVNGPAEPSKPAAQTASAAPAKSAGTE